MVHQQATERVEIEITQVPGPGVDYRFPYPFGNRIDRVELDGHQVTQGADDRTLVIPAGVIRIMVDCS
jgi:hypothetical protein